METIDDIVRDMRIGDIRAVANTSSAVERKAFEYINDFLAGYADRIEVASKERESELLMKFEGAFLWILNHADLTPRACIADVPPRSIHVILDEIYVFAKTFLLQIKENKEESMSEEKSVRPDGYKATDEEVAQQEEMIERKGLSCDVAVAENATTSSTCKESLQVGNSAKMREALEYLRDASREFCHLILNSKYNEVFDKYKHSEVAKIRDAIVYANAALAEPLRNCDVGTPREQAERFNDFCNSHYSLNNPEGVCSECPLTRDGSTCEFEWLQLPYKKECEE